MPEENGIRLITDANTAPFRTTKPTTSGDTQPQESRPSTIKVTLECDIDLLLLRKQKRALVGVREGTPVTYEQETAAEGILSLLDFIQDSIFEQGLAAEEEIFPRLPQLFDPEPSSLDAAA